MTFITEERLVASDKDGSIEQLVADIELGVAYNPERLPAIWEKRAYKLAGSGHIIGVAGEQAEIGASACLGSLLLNETGHHFHGGVSAPTSAIPQATADNCYGFPSSGDADMGMFTSSAKKDLAIIYIGRGKCMTNDNMFYRPLDMFESMYLVPTAASLSIECTVVSSARVPFDSKSTVDPQYYLDIAVEYALRSQDDRVVGPLAHYLASIKKVILAMCMV